MPGSPGTRRCRGPIGPSVAMCVLLEHGGGGGADAGPVARDLLEMWASLQAPAIPQADPGAFKVRRVR